MSFYIKFTRKRLLPTPSFDVDCSRGTKHCTQCSVVYLLVGVRCNDYVYLIKANEGPWALRATDTTRLAKDIAAEGCYCMATQIENYVQFYFPLHQRYIATEVANRVISCDVNKHCVNTNIDTMDPATRVGHRPQWSVVKWLSFRHSPDPHLGSMTT